MSLVSVYEISRRKASLNKRVNESKESKESLSNDSIILASSEGDETRTAPPTFIPENPSACQLIRNLFMDEKSADVVIQVIEKPESVTPGANQSILGQVTNLTTLCGPGVIGQVKKFTGLCGPGQEEPTSPISDTKTAQDTFLAHNFILMKCSTTLSELSRSGSPIQITNISPDTFRFVLSYMYGFAIAKDDMKAHTKDIMEAADWLNVFNLKLEAEACYVESITFTIENVMDHLLYADSKNYALLKEAALDFIMMNKSHVLKKVWTDNAPKHILADILTAMAGEETGANATNRDGQFSRMRVSDLRWQAYSKGLDVDGSREMLIAALQQSS
jgi:hypothetical protein